MKISYYGHSAFKIEEGNFKGIIDPYITENEQCNITLKDLSDLTHIFITHGHADHLGDAVELAMNTGALIIANAEISKFIKSKGVKNVHSMHIGGRFSFDFGIVKMTSAVHGSGIYDNGKVIEGGNPGGFLINIKSKKVYHAGDTGLTYDMKLLEDEGIDIALLPIGGNYTMDMDDAVKAVELIKPKMVIPMHYIKWPLINVNPKEFVDKVKKAETIIIGLNETVIL